jgi:predicted NUDIX family phosphoesterase
MEFVFVVPRRALFPDCYPQGFVAFADAGSSAEGSAARARSTAFDLRAFESVIARDGYFVEREHAERDPELKQIIPYSIIACGEHVLLTKRTKRGGESRLHDKYSIGIGGHINPQDVEPAALHARDSLAAPRRDGAAPAAPGGIDPIAACTRREIDEELCVKGAYEVRRVGLINDDSNAVGAVHVGVVQVIDVLAPVDIRERDQLEGRLATLGDLRALLAQGANIESWSQLLIAHLDELLPRSLAATS